MSDWSKIIACPSCGAGNPHDTEMCLSCRISIKEASDALDILREQNEAVQKQRRARETPDKDSKNTEEVFVDEGIGEFIKVDDDLWETTITSKERYSFALHIRSEHEAPSKRILDYVRSWLSEWTDRKNEIMHFLSGKNDKIYGHLSDKEKHAYDITKFTISGIMFYDEEDIEWPSMGLDQPGDDLRMWHLWYENDKPCHIGFDT